MIIINIVFQGSGVLFTKGSSFFQIKTNAMSIVTGGFCKKSTKTEVVAAVNEGVSSHILK
jgi:hypothetical protein